MATQEKNDQITRGEIIEKIMKSLGQDGAASRTVLVGEAGIGKTWLAKKVSESVTEEKKEVTEGVTKKTPSSYNVLWLHLNKRIEEEKVLYENLAAQLSLFCEFEEGEERNEHNDTLDGLKEKITKKINNNNKKNLLLILDDEGSMTTENRVMEGLKLREFLEKHSALKTLITKRKDERDEKESTTTIKVGPLTEDESQKLLSKSRGLLELLNFDDWPVLLQSLKSNGEITNSDLMSCILSKSKGLPAAIVVLNNSLDSIKSFSEKQKKNFKDLILPSKSIFEELILSSKSLDAAAASKNAVDLSRYNPVLRLSYELLKADKTVRGPVIACFWHVLDFYEYSGCAYYRDLIVHWMLEGYFDPVKSVEKAYQEGHSILMEFMNRGILKIQEDNIVVPEFSMSKLLDLQDCGFFGRSCLGFDRVYGGDKRKGLGKIVLINDTIQTIQSKKKKITTFIASGNRLRREVPGKFFEKTEMQDLEVVVLFEPTFHDLVQSLSKLKKLRVLVIRDCDLIKNIDELAGLEGLHVLEVSGACSLVNISDDFFKNMTQLQSLNLSGLAITSSPPTIEKLSKLRCFILRDCSELQDLPNFNWATKELEVIDIRGARNLKLYFDRVKDWKDYKGKNKNFAHLQQLEHLDFSETQIIRLPIFHLKDSCNDFSTMPSLTRLLLRNCTKLRRLPQLKPLTDLKILDVYGATSLVEMLEVCLEEKKKLRILDISKTSLPELADTIDGVINLNKLLLRNCSQITELPSIENLTHLEVFDVSGCNKLEKIGGSFGEMSYLHEVNLSETSLGKLPDKISELSNLKKLIIRNCSKLKALPNLEKLTHLEVFDILGCTELDKVEGSFENMSYLCKVNLSGTNLDELPDKISELSNLKELIIRNCSKLKALPNLEKLTHLEVFDISGCTELDKVEGSFKNMSYLCEVNLSGTNLDELPGKISELSNLKELIIRNCSKLKALPNLEKLAHLEILDVSGCTELNKIEGSFENMSYLCEVNLSETKFKKIPELPKQSILCSLKRIVLADSSCLERDEWSQIKDCLEIISEGNREKIDKLVHHGERYRVLDPEAPSGKNIVEINRSVDPAKEEYVSIAEKESTSVSSIFHEFQMRSVKGCWVERCKKMENIFESDEKKDKEQSSSSSSSPLETLWISNLPLLKSLCSSKGGIFFKNLKKLSIDCCPSIKVLFYEIPDNLEVLRVKFCDQLERLFEVEVGELPKLHKLYLLDLPVLSTVGAKLPKLEKPTFKKCPNLKDTEDELRLGTRITEEISEDQPHKTFGPEIQTPTQPSKATSTV